MRRLSPLPLWIPVLGGAGLGVAIGLVAVETTCTALFGEVSWDCRSGVHLLGRTFSPSVGVTLAGVFLATLGAALGLIVTRSVDRQA